MSDLPPFDINLLVQLRDVGESRDDRTSNFIGSECRVAVYAYDNGSKAIGRQEWIGVMQYLRLLCETTIRIRWIAGDEDVATPDGLPLVAAATVMERVRRLEKRDLMNLRAAYVAVHAAGDGSAPLVGGLTKLIERILDRAAPSTVKDLATARTARQIYAGHRLYSSRVHAGAILGRLATDETAEEHQGQIEALGHMCTGWAEAELRVLADS